MTEWWQDKMHIISAFFRRIKRRFKRIKSWLPILWNDEEWDYTYLFRIMRFKISRMRKEIEKNGRHVGYEKQVEEMKIAEFVLNRLAEHDFYFDNNERFKEHAKKGKCTCPEILNTYKELPHGCTRMNFHHCEFCKKSFKYWYKREDAKERADLQYVFNYIAKKCQRWWD